MKTTVFVAGIVSAIVFGATMVGPTSAAIQADAQQALQTPPLEDGSQACPYLRNLQPGSSMACPYTGSSEKVQAECPYLKQRAASGECPYSGAESMKKKPVKARNARNV